MYLYHFFKKIFLKRFLKFQEGYERFRSEISTVRYMKALMQKKDLPELSKAEIKEAKDYFKSKGYKLKNTYWHKYYKGLSGEFHKDYMPYDIFYLGKVLNLKYALLQHVENSQAHVQPPSLFF